MKALSAIVNKSNYPISIPTRHITKPAGSPARLVTALSTELSELFASRDRAASVSRQSRDGSGLYRPGGVGASAAALFLAPLQLGRAAPRLGQSHPRPFRRLPSLPRVPVTGQPTTPAVPGPRRPPPRPRPRRQLSSADRRAGPGTIPNSGSRREMGDLDGVLPAMASVTRELSKAVSTRSLEECLCAKHVRKSLDWLHCPLFYAID